MSNAPSLSFSWVASPGFSWVALVGLGLTACTFDPSAFHGSGSGGSMAGPTGVTVGSTTQAGASVTATSVSTTATSSGVTSSGTNSTTTATSSATTTASSSTSATSSSTGTPLMLTPCGIPMSHFDNYPTGWNQQDTMAFKYGMGNMNIGVEAQIPSGGQFAGAWLDPMSFDDCYATIDLIDVGSAGKSYLNLWENSSNNVGINYDAFWKTVNTPQTLPVAAAQDRPEALGIAIHAGTVYFLYVPHGAMTWSHGSKQTVSWIGANDISIGFGVAGNSSQWAKFDNFNVRTITGADLW